MARSHKIIYDAAPIGSIETLAKILETSTSRLSKISKSNDDFYTVFEKQVKLKLRELAEPKSELKILQKRIIARIFCHLKFPDYLHGGIKSQIPKDFLSNATVHAKAETAVTVDIKSFYPSITFTQVLHVFQLLFKFPPAVADTLARITTFKGAVPQGAPTSSYIANLVMWEKEYSLASKFEQQGYVYSRLIDDITVSNDKPIPADTATKIVTQLAKMLSAYNYQIHPKKTNIYSKSNPEKLMCITGLWLNRGTPRLEKEKRNKISHAVVDLLEKAKSDKTSEKYHNQFNSISGQVALLQRLEHKEACRLRSILNGIQPIYDDAKIAKIQNIILKFSKRSLEKTKLGYIQKYYQMQFEVSIIKRTNPRLARKLQDVLNKKRPTTTMKSHYE
ncbi:MAG: reverse transcriptase family protein [Candidatus Aquirickettsiella gammari]